eukprot:2099477-Rhodomonas_salina.2
MVRLVSAVLAVATIGCAAAFAPSLSAFQPALHSSLAGSSICVPAQSVRSTEHSACKLRMAGFGKPSNAKSTKAPKKIMGIAKKVSTFLSSFLFPDPPPISLESPLPFVVFTVPCLVAAPIFGGDGRGCTSAKAIFQPSLSKPQYLHSAGACQIHKRLILEYACDLYPNLKQFSKKLELGYSQSITSPLPLPFHLAPSRLPLLCGFGARSDVSGGGRRRQGRRRGSAGREARDRGRRVRLQDRRARLSIGATARASSVRHRARLLVRRAACAARRAARTFSPAPFHRTRASSVAPAQYTRSITPEGASVVTQLPILFLISQSTCRAAPSTCARPKRCPCSSLHAVQ